MGEVEEERCGGEGGQESLVVLVGPRHLLRSAAPPVVHLGASRVLSGLSGNVDEGELARPGFACRPPRIHHTNNFISSCIPPLSSTLQGCLPCELFVVVSLASPSHLFWFSRLSLPAISPSASPSIIGLCFAGVSMSPIPTPPFCSSEAVHANPNFDASALTIRGPPGLEGFDLRDSRNTRSCLVKNVNVNGHDIIAIVIIVLVHASVSCP